MQSIKEDDLLDYNELEQEQIMSLGQHANHKSSGPRETPSPAPDFSSYSPKQTPPSLKSDEDSDEVDSDLDNGQDVVSEFRHDYTRNYTIPFPIHQLLCPNKTDTIKTQ